MALKEYLVFQDWNELLAAGLPLPCTVRTCLTSAAHYEIIEIRMSTIRIGTSTFTECHSASWACCPSSDLERCVYRSIRSFYSSRLNVGKWINHDHRRQTRTDAAVPAIDHRLIVTQSENSANIRLLVEKTVLGISMLATEASTQSTEEVKSFETKLSVLRDQVPDTADRNSKFDQLTELLKKPTSPTSKRRGWRAEWTCACIDLLRLLEGGPKSLQKADNRRKAYCARSMHMVVSALIPDMGVHALVLLLAWEASNYTLTLPQQGWKQEAAGPVAKQLSNISIRLPRDQLWFNPAALISWFMKDSYSSVCEALGLGGLAYPELDRTFADGEVPWASPLRQLFKTQPPPKRWVQVTSCYTVVHPQSTQLPTTIGSADSPSGESPARATDLELRWPQRKRKGTEVATDTTTEKRQGAYHQKPNTLISTCTTMASGPAALQGANPIDLLLQAAEHVTPNNRDEAVMNRD
ncbi:hypothetical protein VM1G_10411 [Cytospora mali]|uniref:Uncharacterized protein n=1 Tax=Cytospora mali TaxID=578113 RepID=A0A194VI85_CYTMA|nr:hypothetical protein VM1G_10411 [Valsa mali]